MPARDDRGFTRGGFFVGLGAAAAVLSATPSAVHAEDREAENVTTAVETLRVAIQDGDGSTLDRLTHPQLTYGHSSGRKNQTKAEFITSLAGKRNYESLTLTDQSIVIVGDNALVRHIWDGADILPDDRRGRSYIAVLQVWLKSSGTWLLLARQSCQLKA